MISGIAPLLIMSLKGSVKDKGQMPAKSLMVNIDIKLGFNLN